MRLTDHSRLIYAPRLEGPEQQPTMRYFAPKGFTRALPEVWRRHFGFVTSLPSGAAAPLVISGLGSGSYARGTKDREWQVTEGHPANGLPPICVTLPLMTRLLHVATFPMCDHPTDGVPPMCVASH